MTAVPGQGPLHRPPLAEEVTARLRESIVAGRWPLGGRIPPEPELVASLGVSRGTLREAVKALAHAGMLEVRRGDGTYVRATSEISGTARRAYREYDDEDVLQVRFALDTQAARLAAQAQESSAKDDGAVAALREMLARRRQAWEEHDLEGWIAADWDFHQAVAAASGNPLLHELYSSFGDVFHGTKMAQRLRDGFDGCLRAGHEDLADAIEAGDADAAAQTVIANLRYCLEWMPPRKP
ncbi:FadR/GntR family transcriptional regulator [Arthrobacter sulfonylureivorans]|uniref:FadR family transcriptional regulator n=1 Tax=Arthrobacter sulfonylureivorans TaxID=2486855 RepID=A0ABY3WB22_9MICC|nr:FadR/GntR family transcriptional regulator [Arthrobacter sulfonylureivorans]UNK46385.1 FadR family transcriptional regulator [Arthrobacter sulfonylureivorans]